MRLDQLLEEKRGEILRIASEHGAREVRVFGSVARGEAGRESDSVAEPAVEVLGAFVGQAGGHDRVVVQLPHLFLPERDESRPVTLAPRLLLDPQQVHERDLIPKVAVSEETDPPVFHVRHDDLAAGYLLPDDVTADMM